MNDDFYKSKDKYLVPFLLTQSDKVTFRGHEVVNGVVYFRFFPISAAQDLAQQFQSNAATPVNPRRLFDAQEVFRDIIHEVKGGIYGS